MIPLLRQLDNRDHNKGVSTRRKATALAKKVLGESPDDHVIRVGENCWGEAEDKVERYFQRGTKPVRVYLGGKLAYRVSPGEPPKRLKH